MQKIKFTYWRDGEYYIGFLNDYPDYETQGNSKEERLFRNSCGTAPKRIDVD